MRVFIKLLFGKKGVERGLLFVFAVFTIAVVFAVFFFLFVVKYVHYHF
jgi:hypothetical protein